MDVYLDEKWVNAFGCEMLTPVKKKFFVLGRTKTTGGLGISFLDHPPLWRDPGIVLFERSCKCAVFALNICILSAGNC